MAEKSGGLPRCLNTKVPFTGRKAACLPKNPLSRLQYREFGGLHRLHKQSVRSQIFLKLPGRLGFSLNCLVDESILYDGSVFLGFTKNGQFVLSYTLNVEADEHTAYPIYAYRLQWWHFVPYKKLRKVAQVKLFGEEDIQQELFLSMCEWPTDDTRVLIHGYCAAQHNEEKRQCFVTITAVPPVGPCEDCSQMAILQAQTASYGGSYDVAVRCLNHGFTVHSKYELAPPYPVFAPKVFLKLDGVVILNTGDSLIALSSNIEDNHGGFGFALYSPRVGCGSSSISTADASDDVTSSDMHSEPLPLEELDNNPDVILGHWIASPTCSNMHMARTASAGTTTPVLPRYSAAGVRERRPSFGKENVLTNNNKQLNSPSMTDAASASGSAKHNRALDVYNFEGSTPKKEDESSDYFECANIAPSGSVRATLSFHEGARMHVTSEEICLFQNESMDSQPLDALDKAGLFEKPTPVLRMQPRDLSSSANFTGNPSKPFTNLSLITGDTFGLGKALCISPGYGKMEQCGSSTCSSCVSSPIILQSDSQCFTYSVRRFMESYGPPRPDSPIDIEDDLNLAYHSVLPIEVHGTNYSPMRLQTKQFPTPHTPCVVVKQLTLDIEHYLGESVRTTAEWGHRYIAFTDYDVQIVEVCPDTSEVIALVYVLIRARPPKDKHVHGMRSMPKLYESGFKLVWNLKTGMYTTLDIEDLVEVNQAELLRKQWHPGRRIFEALQRRFAVPQAYSQSVHVLTNEPVFRGNTHCQQTHK
ncbi:hypothetical protein NP493_583g02001 [Ridgeia piscesae]|uniref:DDB1- and CUL4-associated factor 15 WD40 repeat-containing domain-containing protein n=1 Tax=Ridgeia piscesae TaxID=27915 RepID=A0AAD9KU44_RIDPI|nr:hypothetical protein NP493_583g02001 [Ridgeia piscesae]